MKNKSGFTLVELVSVIIVLAILAIILIPTVQKAIANAKTSISAINEKNIKDAGKTYANEIIYCDDTDFTTYSLANLTFLGITGGTINANKEYCIGTTCHSICYMMKEKLTSSGMIVNINFLVSKGIFNNTANCRDANGQPNRIILTSDADYNILVTIQNMTCN